MGKSRSKKQPESQNRGDDPDLSEIGASDEERDEALDILDEIRREREEQERGQGGSGKS